MLLRSMLFTIATVALALVGVALWVHQVHGILAGSKQADTVLPVPRPYPASTQKTPTEQLSAMARGTILLSFLLTCFLVVVGLAAASREWIRYLTRKPPARGKEKTAYVDAWKIAGERAAPEPPEELEEPPEEETE